MSVAAPSRARGHVHVGAATSGGAAAAERRRQLLLLRRQRQRLTWVPPRWRPRGRPPGRSRSRCTWSCQCRTCSTSGRERQRVVMPLRRKGACMAPLPPASRGGDHVQSRQAGGCRRQQACRLAQLDALLRVANRAAAPPRRPCQLLSPRRLAAAILALLRLNGDGLSGADLQQQHQATSRRAVSTGCAACLLAADAAVPNLVASPTPATPSPCPATHRLAQLAGDAALLPRGVAAQRVLATEPGAQRALLKGVVDLVVAGARRRGEAADAKPTANRIQGGGRGGDCCPPATTLRHPSAPSLLHRLFPLPSATPPHQPHPP